MNLVTVENRYGVCDECTVVMISLEGAIYMQSLLRDPDIEQKLHVSCIMSGDQAFACSMEINVRLLCL